MSGVAVQIIVRDVYARASASARVLTRAYLIGAILTFFPFLLSVFRSKHHLWKYLVKLLGPRSFAMAFALAFGGSRWVSDNIRAIALQHVEVRPDQGKGDIVKRYKRVEVMATFAGAAISGSLALSLLQGRSLWKRQQASLSPLPLRSRSTLDLTLFAVVRALDVSVRATFFHLISSATRQTSFMRLIAGQADAFLFWASSWRIMWIYFYKPQLLPKPFAKWISHMAQVDDRLLHLLQMAKSGSYEYGSPLALADATIVRSLASSHNVMYEAVNPMKISKIPCQLVHGHTGNTASCTVNTIKRFSGAFSRGLLLYTVVHSIPQLLIHRKYFFQYPGYSFMRLSQDILRSSSFLATFVGSIWATICFLRSFGPKLFRDQMFWDGGGITATATGVCGLSILLEKRRDELALSVAPRALATFILPARVSERAEQMVFGLAFASLVTAQSHKPELLRGIVRHVFRLIEPNEKHK